MAFKITKPGEYRMRNNMKAIVEFRSNADLATPWMGYVGPFKAAYRWRDNGLHSPSGLSNAYDIIAPWLSGWTTLQEWVDAGGDGQAFKDRWNACRHDGELAQWRPDEVAMWKGHRCEAPAAFGRSPSNYRLKLDEDGNLPEPPKAEPDWLPEGCEHWSIEERNGRLGAVISREDGHFQFTRLHTLIDDVRLVGFAYHSDAGIEINGLPIGYKDDHGNVWGYTAPGRKSIRPFAVVMRKEGE